tara:strand:- start:1786 stop:2877 length:1092 start_codon:yes stop_codon:yes gene_type:complete
MPKLLLKTPEEYKQELKLYKQLKNEVAIIFKTPEFERQELIQALKLEKESKEAAEKLIFDQISTKESTLRNVIDIDEFNRTNNALERNRSIFSRASLDKYTISELEKTKFILTEIRRVEEDKGSTSKSRYINDTIAAINRRLADKTRVPKKVPSKSAATPGAVGAPPVASPIPTGSQETKGEAEEDDEDEDDEYENAEDDAAKNAEQDAAIERFTALSSLKVGPLLDNLKQKYPGIVNANGTYLNKDRLIFLLSTDFSFDQTQEFISKLVKSKNNDAREKVLNARLKKLNTPIAELQIQAIASAAKRKSQTPKKGAIEGEGLSKTKKSKPKSKSKSIGKQEQIYYILSKKAGNNNKLMKKRLK